MPIDEFAASLNVIGNKKNTDSQGTNIVTGKYDFAADHIFPGKLHARILGARYAHAKILSIDTSKAAALPGVVAVATYQDVPNWSANITMAEQEVAIVAAVDEATAERALDLITVNYDVLIPVLDPEEAMKPNSPKAGIAGFTDSNLSPTPQQVTFGDVTKGFTEAEVTVEETTGWRTRHTHNELEPASATAMWMGDELYVWVPGKNPFNQRATVATGLKMPLNKVHFKSHGTGGSFGTGKYLPNIEISAAVVAKKAGKAVTVHLPRKISNCIQGHQYGGKSIVKIGAKKDGTLTAIDMNFWNEGGNNGGRGGFGDVLQSTVDCPNFRSNQWAVATNKGPNGSWRCVQHPDGAVLSTIAVEKLAAKLNMNPLDFRRKIFLKTPVFTTNGGAKTPLYSFGTNACMEKAAEAIGWASNYHAPGVKTLPDGRLHGIGIWAHADGHGGASGTRGMIINMNEDGTVLFNSGASRNMGGPAAQQAIMAEVIGVPFDSVRCGEWGDCDVASEGGNQGGSTLTISIGSACIGAAEDVRNQLFAVAAGTGTGMLKTTPDALDAKDGKIFIKADPTKFVTHAAVMAAIAQPVIGKGTMRSPSLRKDVGTYKVGAAGTHRTGCASAAEVAVDPETGLVEVTNFANAVDYGRIIDWNSSDGQISAGLQVDINQTFFYNDIYDPLTGILLSYGYVHDKIATIMDYDPAINKTFMLETIDASGPFGCHGVGEPVVGTFASIVNAVNNALGVWVTEYPMTPQVILKALGKG